MKKNSIFTSDKRFYSFMCMVLLLMICFSGTVAYYNFGVNGVINASTAAYNFNITSDSISNTNIDLGNGLMPYDSGSFTVNINMPDTYCDVQYSINIERVSLPDGFRFLATNDNISPFNNYTKYFSASDTKTDSVTIYWYWDGNVSNENDTSFIGENISANLVIESKVLNGAEMKNGASSEEGANGGTEFWNDTYRPYIRMISFVNNLSNKPSSCTEENLCFDISNSSTQEKRVYGYLLDSGLTVTETDSSTSTSVEKKLYNLYIASDTEIIAPVNCRGLFAYFSNLETINFNDNFNTTKVTCMTYMFYQCKSLINVDLSSFNTSNVISMSGMFEGCNSLISLDLSSFDTSNVTNMRYTFGACYSLTSLDLTHFNTSSVTNMGVMFGSCRSLTSLDLSSFNISNVTGMERIFCNSKNLQTTINIMNANVTNYTEMFLDSATGSNAKIIVNYTAETETLVDNMILTKSSNSNVVKGIQI